MLLEPHPDLLAVRVPSPIVAVQSDAHVFLLLAKQTEHGLRVVWAVYEVWRLIAALLNQLSEFFPAHCLDSGFRCESRSAGKLSL